MLEKLFHVFFQFSSGFVVCVGRGQTQYCLLCHGQIMITLDYEKLGMGLKFGG